MISQGKSLFIHVIVNKHITVCKNPSCLAGGLQPRKNDSAKASISLARTGCSGKHSSVKPQTRHAASTTAVFHGLKLFIHRDFNRTGSRGVASFHSWQHRSVLLLGPTPFERAGRRSDSVERSADIIPDDRLTTARRPGRPTVAIASCSRWTIPSGAAPPSRAIVTMHPLSSRKRSAPA